MFPQARCVRTFVVTMGEQPFLEELICKDAGLWEAPNLLPHFKVNKTIEGMFIQSVLFDNPFGEYL